MLWILLLACDPPDWVDPTKTPPDLPEDTDVAEPEPVVDTAPEPEVDPTPFVDADGDGVEDTIDNCVDDANPGQEDVDGDTEGDPCDADVDGDAVPNDRDLFPTDPTKPGTASPDTVYAHGPSELFSFNVSSRIIRPIGAFTFDRSGGSITDIAIDRYGVLYAVTFTDAFVCHPQQATCWHIGSLAGSYNGLTILPPAFQGAPERLVGIANAGTWTEYNGIPFQLLPQALGGYGGPSSSGDVFYIEGTGCFGAVEGLGSSTTIVETDLTGHIVRQVGAIPGVYGIYGLAGWSGVIYIFAANGEVHQMDPVSGVSNLVTRGSSWWGAGVRTVIVP